MRIAIVGGVLLAVVGVGVTAWYIYKKIPSPTGP